MILSGTDPSWRLNWAKEYSKEYRTFKEVEFEEDEDELVIKLTEYLFARKDTQNFSEIKLFKSFPLMYPVFGVYFVGLPYGDRWVIEALALTDLTDEEIAEYTQYDAKFVNVFCKCFFDVREKDKKERYIRLMYRSASRMDGITIWDAGWKYVAAFLGPDEFFNLFLNREKMGHQQLQWLMQDSMKMSALTAWWTHFKQLAAVDQRRSPDVIDIEAKLISTNRAYIQDTSAEDSDAINKDIVGLLENLDMSMADATVKPKEKAEPRLIKMDTKKNGKNVKK